MQVVDEFMKLYYDSKDTTWRNTWWIGHRTWKCPLDLWIFQEIITEIRPDVIVECGTGEGGSALYLANICDLVNHGEIITIDLKLRKKFRHDRIRFILGDSVSDDVVEQVSRLAREKTVMAILDSTHHKSHVLRELEIYGSLVTVGNYIIVEDTIVNGHPAYPNFNDGGPMEAAIEFLSKNPNFVVDKKREKFLLTINPSGYLRKVSDESIRSDSSVK